MNVCPFCGSMSYGSGCRRCATGMAGLFKGVKSKKASKTERETRHAIKEAGKSQARAIEEAARIGLEAQKVHEGGELAKARVQALIKWGAVAGGVVLTALLALGTIAIIRKKRRE